MPDVTASSEPHTAPHLTLPTVPSTDVSVRDADRDTRPGGRRHRTLLAGRRADRALRAAPEIANDPWDQESWSPPAWKGGSGPNQSQLPALPDAYPAEDALHDSSGRLRASSDARPLPPTSKRGRQMVARVLTADDVVSPMALSTASVPDLVAYRPPRVRSRVDTRAIIESARSPWSLTRICLAFLAMVLAIVTTASVAGESPQPLMFYQAAAGAGPAGDIAWPVNAITAKVQPATQLRRTDLYDSVDQFNQWGGAACSAAALSEVLTAYGVPNATIGHMIDELGSDISPSWGLVTYDGFAKVAAAHGLRADIYVDKQLTYPQMQYLTNTLGLPVIVNVRISYGYYHFFSGGHFMVMTYGDDQGVRLVDSSLYYVKYLPMDVFHSMFTGRTAVIVPKDLQYTLPT